MPLLHRLSRYRDGATAGQDRVVRARLFGNCADKSVWFSSLFPRVHPHFYFLISENNIVHHLVRRMGAFPFSAPPILSTNRAQYLFTTLLSPRPAAQCPEF